MPLQSGVVTDRIRHHLTDLKQHERPSYPSQGATKANHKHIFLPNGRFCPGGGDPGCPQYPMSSNQDLGTVKYEYALMKLSTFVSTILYMSRYFPAIRKKKSHHAPKIRLDVVSCQTASKSATSLVASIGSEELSSPRKY